jgi:hypothetical protein
MTVSRKTYDITDWCLIAGFDSTTSTFVEVWRQPYDDQDQPVLMVNNTGVRVYDDNLPPAVLRAMTHLRGLFADAKSMGNPYPNLGAEHANLIARAFGFPDMTTKFLLIFDGDEPEG